MKIAVALGVVSVSACLALACAWFVPLGIDGGWYSYPGYALSMGRDPGENLLAIDAVTELPQSVRAIFNYELRSFLIVPLHAAWFKVAGTSLVSLKIFGALQWVLVAALVGACLSVATGHRTVAAIGALTALSDSWVISQSMSDLRPDVPNAIVAMICTLALLSYHRGGRTAWLVTATVSAMALALLHITSVLGLTYVAMLAVVLAAWPRADQRRRLQFLLVPIAAAVVFLWRQPIMDYVVPTKLPAVQEIPYRDDLWAYWQGIVDNGVAAKLVFELDRWLDYFLVGNLAQLLFIVVGVSGLVVTRRMRSDPVSMAFVLAAMVTVPIAMIIDPSSTRGHLIPLACLAYVAAGIGLAETMRSTGAPYAIRILVTIGLIAIVLRGAMVSQVVQSNFTSGVSNRNLERFMADVLEPGSAQVVIAPTFLWPYVSNSGSVVLLEPGSRTWQPDDDRWRFVSRVIIDRDFKQRGWSEFSARMERCSSFIKQGSVGTPGGNTFFLEAYRVVAKPCSQRLD